MGRIIHFEIHVDDMERAKLFYGDVFGWTFEDWTAFTGTPYFGAITGDASEPGINGALMQRQSAPPEVNQGLNAFVCTMGTEDYDETEALILEKGGKVAMPKNALTGMAWQGYYFDTEGNLFGIHQPDLNAK
jgi:predicted enzyme related to lactoylglutathione lyase